MNAPAQETPARTGDAWRRPPPDCSATADRPASAYCSECLEAFDPGHLGIRADGRAICRPCAWENDVPLVNQQHPGGAEIAFQRGLVRAMEGLLLHPARIFAHPPPARIGSALVFGYAVTVVGYALWLGWLLYLHPEWVDAQMEEAGLSPDAGRWMAWLLLPVLALVRVFAGALALHAGCLLAGGNARPFAEVLRAFCLASASMVFCIIPQYGPLLTVLWWSWIVLAWMRSRWRFGIMRTLVALVPSVVVLPLLGPAATPGL